MWEAIATWFLKVILDYLLGKAKVAVEEKAAEIKKDQERGEVNEANLKAYEEAVERKERIDAAESLLNGDRS